MVDSSAQRAAQLPVRYVSQRASAGIIRRWPEGSRCVAADEKISFDFVAETCGLAASHAFCSLAGYSKAVDIFNGFTSAWSTAKLSVARSDLAATSLPALGLAFFAGGESDTGLFFL